jgi:hypothetical protein
LSIKKVTWTGLDWTRASMVRSQRLATRAMEWPVII